MSAPILTVALGEYDTGWHNTELSLGTKPTMLDSDGDGLGDGLEVQFGSDPLKSGLGGELGAGAGDGVGGTAAGLDGLDQGAGGIDGPDGLGGTPDGAPH